LSESIEFATFDHKNVSPRRVLEWAFEQFGESTPIISSFQMESCILIHEASKILDEIRVVTVDTGRLPEQTHELIDYMQKCYKLKLEVLYPDPTELSYMVSNYGNNCFYQSVSLRKYCCRIRKVKPLEKFLANERAWITGIRKGQTDFRKDVKTVQEDPLRPGKIRIAPLADWTFEQVKEFVRIHNVPYSKLYDMGYLSIGCAPCTRAVQDGEGERDGRWWWEPKEEPKECGIMFNYSYDIKSGGI
jgi:phosphoadenosine phosphosulfate reductase